MLPELLGITTERWAEIVEACAVRVVAMNQMAEEEELQIYFEDVMIESFDQNIKPINMQYL